MNKSRPSLLKKIRLFGEAVGFFLITSLMKSIGLAKASQLGGWLGRHVGPLLPVNRTARRNLSMVFPSLSSEEKENLIKSVWEEWGRVIGEYLNIPSFKKDISRYIEVQGADIIHQLVQDEKPALLITAHLSQFQLISLAAEAHGLSLVQLYRRANNSFVDKEMYRVQSQATEKVLSRGASGIREIYRSLQKGDHLLMLIDQKVQQSLIIPFMGHPAATTNSPAALARKFKCPVVMARTERTGPLSFRVSFYPPLFVEQQTDEEVMQQLNTTIGEWVYERPEQWFWLHNRWKI
jgi:KDO2-lipid IV(A) lauroyltransferase